jgi:serine protease Do
MKRVVLMVSLSALVALAGCRSTGLAGAPPGASPGGAPLALSVPATPGQPDAELARISKSLARLADRLRPALVEVRLTGALPEAEVGERSEEQRQPRRGLGSGFIVSSDGYIITNYHVVSGASGVQVRFFDGRRLSARVVGTDARTDLAVLKVDGVEHLPVMQLGDSDAVQVGELVMALGSPFGLEQSVSLGIVSRKPSRPGVATPGFQFVQTDAAVTPGNSGGPLVNMAGEVVGVNSMASSNGSLGFAIPSRVVQAVVPTLAAKGKVRWGWLGISITEAEEPGPGGSSKPIGVLVRNVRPGEPAARAGMKPGDIVTSVDGVPIREPRDLQHVVAGLEPGKKVSVALTRAGRQESVVVEIGEAPEE